MVPGKPKESANSRWEEQNSGLSGVLHPAESFPSLVSVDSIESCNQNPINEKEA